MDKYLLISNFNMFTINQDVLLIDENTNESVVIGHFSLENLPKALIEYAYTNDVYKIKLFNGSKYIPLIEYEVKSQEKLKYNKNKIEIEVI